MKSAEGRPAIIIDCGIDDFFYDVNVALHEAMQHNNIAHTFITRPGVHTHSYWHYALPFQLLFSTSTSKERLSPNNLTHKVLQKAAIGGFCIYMDRQSSCSKFF